MTCPGQSVSVTLSRCSLWPSQAAIRAASCDPLALLPGLRIHGARTRALCDSALQFPPALSGSRAAFCAPRCPHTPGARTRCAHLVALRAVCTLQRRCILRCKVPARHMRAPAAPCLAAGRHVWLSCMSRDRTCSSWPAAVASASVRCIKFSMVRVLYGPRWHGGGGLSLFQHGLTGSLRRPFRLARFWLPLKSRLSKIFVRRIRESRASIEGMPGKAALTAPLPGTRDWGTRDCVCGTRYVARTICGPKAARAHGCGGRRSREWRVTRGLSEGHSAAPRSRRRWRVSGRAAPLGSPDD